MKPMLSLTTSILKLFGFTEIYQAQNGEDGFKKFCQHNTDIILTDWLMEPCDGLEMTRLVRNESSSPNRFVPIVMMTGYSHRMRVESARDIGVTEFLVKPFRARDLYARIEQLVEKPRRFVDTGEFFGPDRRRRKKDGNAQVPQRRESDFVEVEAPPMEKGTSDILKRIQAQARDAAKSK